MDKYKEMTKTEINEKVAELEGFELQGYPCEQPTDGVVAYKNGVTRLLDYCNSWTEGGPIVERVFGDLNSVDNLCIGTETKWQRVVRELGCNKLTAAMVIFVDNSSED